MLLIIKRKRNVIYVRLRFHRKTFKKALKSRATGKEHCKRVKEWKETCSFFTKRQWVSKSSEKEKDVEQVENVTPKTAPTCSKIGQCTIPETFLDEVKIHAKILRSIKHILEKSTML